MEDGKAKKEDGRTFPNEDGVLPAASVNRLQEWLITQNAGPEALLGTRQAVGQSQCVSEPLTTLQTSFSIFRAVQPRFCARRRDQPAVNRDFARRSTGQFSPVFAVRRVAVALEHHIVYTELPPGPTFTRLRSATRCAPGNPIRARAGSSLARARYGPPCHGLTQSRHFRQPAIK
jgi:hypothetical protein